MVRQEIILAEEKAVVDEVSLREFARREACSHTLVQKAVRFGHLPALPSGKLDAALVGTDWWPTGRPEQPLPVPDPLPEPLRGETLAATAQRLLDTGGEMRTKAEAERVKENYLALLRQLEFETKSRAVVPMADMEVLVDQVSLIFRSGLEAIPGRLSAELAGLSNPAVIKDRLTHEHRRVLQACSARLASVADASPQDGREHSAAPEPDRRSVGERGARAAGGKRRARPVP